MPFKGIKDVLKILSRRYNLGILTTNQTRIVEKFVNKHKFNFFSFVHSEKVVFGTDKCLRKVIAQHGLNSEETYYIGDETRDIEAAKRQRVKTIAVTWGAESKNLLRKANPDIIISEPKELLSL
ncbi:hypothetical protein A2962_05585 [Candidatus Woesebacteria bacterium RIFCSPLOWO2_01_FULL_39_61]|uniref:HAD-superfamily hydrolase n=2 Tax=Microgenomates group TaxID=1794810 RepID=A0A0H4T5E9_9BACT|nr:HAD-superfamily hydrolase [uncultured Microgenomates bacterium Rifle_16ft_4_minimus_37836]OGM28059.1 MAG: hypothetical protein A2692_05325 [Candidatus Woesebacteria bacterium RIFCSPHIGHO2_01_FULL_39_95]OGM34047.1 MAG: hypothetical protein A3D01_03895 [Candidatus Woesebacteria bacterium RIFCSPHIGHO2_02_FULL_39_13]OGM38305.1 MAG: hypothetical protein A3E13_06005 [Candidatus Woesebacteria bacterium RIFCSPHIGHO2_12_FULL_40_20]OGM67768.1 MAG: hypothetical protein A2962_05585 [Candidatus Woesebact